MTGIRIAILCFLPFSLAVPRKSHSTGTSGRSCRTPAFDVMVPMPVRGWRTCDLDIREEALKPKRNGTPIVPGDPDHSEIIQRIFAKDGRVMPPPYAHKELTRTQKDTIRRWVAQGAKYEGHWSYQPVTRPPVPALNGARSNEPDRRLHPSPFGRGKIKAVPRSGSPYVDPSRNARSDRPCSDTRRNRGLRRRQSPDAYEKLVDRLTRHTGLRGKTGRPLARRGPVRRYRRISQRRDTPGLALPRLCAALVPRQQAV